MAKTNSGWLVVVPAESTPDVLKILYQGPDKNKARERAQKALDNGKASRVDVLRITRRASLTSAALVSHLPRKAF